jgi:hypothetical protein
MSEPSRQDIRTQLRQATRQINHVVKRLTGRWLPVDQAIRSGPRDHQASIKADGSMCCQAHEDVFVVDPGATARYQDHLSGGQIRYIERHLGHHPGPGPRR